MRSALVALVLLNVFACELAVVQADSNSLAWRHFKQSYGKTYGTQEEDTRRFGIFMANKQRIDQHNANASASFFMALNFMSDRAPEELERGADYPPIDGLNDAISQEELDRFLGSTRDDPMPDEFDWRKHEGRVGPVGNQGDCDGSWAFTATGVLEGQELVRNMTSFVSLSQQLFLDCSTYTKGCGGGWTWNGIDDINDNIGGVESEIDYPFVGEVLGKCHTNASKFLTPIKPKDHILLPYNDEKTLKKTLVKYGPVAVAFRASWTYLHYSSGFFEDHTCYTRRRNHNALLVGYGKDPQKGEYWILKNSWGTEWGEQGYIRFKAGVNMCSISDFSTIPTFHRR